MTTVASKPKSRAPIRKDFEYKDIPDRKIKEATCKAYSYGVTKAGEHIANYRDDTGHVLSQKIRDASKNFSVTGEGKLERFFAQDKFNGGRAIVITEGELDCLSVAQALNLKYPVVSLPSGAQAAAKAISKNLEWLDKFEKVILSFDKDEPGLKALSEAASLLPPGKAYVMNLGAHKDANEALMKDGPGFITSAYWGAKQWQPGGIIDGSSITLDDLKESITQGYSTDYPKLNEMLGGLRKRELILLTAGTGIGKSTFARELAYQLHQKHGLTIGNVYLEESYKKTAQGYIALHMNKPLGWLRRDPSILTDKQWEKAKKEVLHERMYFYDHFGSMASDSLLGKLRYLAVSAKCDFIVLDHISIVISGTQSSTEGERRDIDVLMTKLRMLVEETGVGIIAICHLRQPEGVAHEEGGKVSLNQLRGSGSLKQIPDAIVALERDQQSEDKRDKSDIRILKNRELGELGKADTVYYIRSTGRLIVPEVKTEELKAEVEDFPDDTEEQESDNGDQDGKPKG